MYAPVILADVPPLVVTSEFAAQTFALLEKTPELLAGKSLRPHFKIIPLTILYLGMTIYMFQCQTLASHHVLGHPTSPVSPTRSILPKPNFPETYYQVVTPNLVSEFEKIHFWHGVSANPPELVYRSDHETNPFPVPPPGARFFKIAAKTAQGVFNTPLNLVWGIVAPKIILLFKERGIKYSALLPVRFSSYDEVGKKTLGPITLWISTHIGRNTPEEARDASPHVLKILEDHGVTGAVTQWSRER